jgi:hypothetical protein
MHFWPLLIHLAYCFPLLVVSHFGFVKPMLPIGKHERNILCDLLHIVVNYFCTSLLRVQDQSIYIVLKVDTKGHFLWYPWSVH